MHLQNKNGSLTLSCRFYQTELNNPSELDKVGSACHRFLVFDQMQDSLKHSTLKIERVCFFMAEQNVICDPCGIFSRQNKYALLLQTF